MLHNFSVKQQIALLLLFAFYGIWLGWFVRTHMQRGVRSCPLERPIASEQKVYIDPPIAINTTTDAYELQLLPGIGEVLARRILAYREQNGTFQNPEALLPIKRIGPKTVQKLQYYLVFSEEPGREL